MIIAISFILGLGLWLYGLKTAFVTGINIDAIFFLWSNNKIEEVLKKYIKENWGK